MGYPLRDRLTVGLRPLEASILVRVQVPQPIDFTQIFDLVQNHRSELCRGTTIIKIKSSYFMAEQIQEEQTKEKAKKGPMLKKVIGPVMALAIVAGAGYWAFTSGMLDFSNLGIGGSDKFIATVNGQGIEQRLFDTRFAQEKNAQESQGVALNDISAEQLRQQVLEAMIAERLLVQHAKEQGVQVSDQAIQEQYQQIITQFENEGEFEKQLETQNATLQDVKNEIADQIAIQEFADQYAQQQGVTVSAEEIQKTYDDAVAGGAELEPLESLQTQIEAYLRNQKVNELLQALVAQLRGEATVEITS